VIPQTARDANNAKSRGKQALPHFKGNIVVAQWFLVL
jgi:hypothetical protein